VAPYPKVSLEEVLARNPEVIVDMGEMARTAGVTVEQKRAVVTLWSRYPSLAAVKRGHVFAVASDIYVVPGPRMVDAAREFARMLHPEAGS
jgi:iron complex transport system substrate-binding protein